MGKFKKLMPILLFTTLGLGSLVGCGEIEDNKTPDANQDNDEGGNDSGNNDNTDDKDEGGDDGSSENQNTDDKEPETLTRYDFVFDKFKRTETDKERVDVSNLYTASTDFINNIETNNCYILTENTYALRIGSNRSSGSLTFTFKEKIYIKNISFDISKVDEDKAGVNIVVDGKMLDKEINDGLVTFTGVNKYTKSLIIQKKDDAFLNNSFYFKGFEINGEETPNVPKAKYSNVHIDDSITGGTIKLDGDFGEGNIYLGAEISIKATPETGKVLKTLTVNDGTKDKDILSTKKFKVEKDNVTYRIKATFDKKPDKETSEENFKATFENVKNSDSQKIDKSLLVDTSNMIEKVETNFCWTNETAKAIRLGSSSDVGKVKFTFNKKVQIKKLTLTLAPFSNDKNAKAVVTIGTTKISDYPVIDGEVTMPSNGEVYTTETLTIESTSGKRFLLKGIEINGTQEEAIPDTTAKKVTVKCINKTDAHGTISLEGAKADGTKDVEVGQSVLINVTPESKEYRLKSLTYKVNNDGAKTSISHSYGGYYLEVKDINGIYIVEAEFELIPKDPDTEGPSEPEIPLATSSKLVFDKVSSDGGQPLSETTIKECSKTQSNEIDKIVPRQVYKKLLDMIKFQGLVLGTEKNLGQLEINLKKPTIINNIVLDLVEYDFETKDKTTQEITRHHDISRVSIILDELVTVGEIDVRTGKLKIPFDSVVASKIIIRTNGPKQRALIKGFEINSEINEEILANASTVTLDSFTKGKFEIIGHTSGDRVNYGDVINFKVTPDKGCYLDTVKIMDKADNLFEIKKNNNFKITSENDEYLISPVFKEINNPERNDYLASENAHLISFNKVVNNFNEHLTNVRSTYVDNQNLIKSIDIGKGTKIFGGPSLKINPNKEGLIKFTFTREIEISNLVLNASKIKETNSTHFDISANNIDSVEGEQALLENKLTFTFTEPVKTDNLTIHCLGAEKDFYLNSLLINNDLQTYNDEIRYSNLNETATLNIIKPSELKGVEVVEDLTYDPNTSLSGFRYKLSLKNSEAVSPRLIVNGKMIWPSDEYWSNEARIISFKLETGLNIVEIVYTI